MGSRGFAFTLALLCAAGLSTACINTGGEGCYPGSFDENLKCCSMMAQCVQLSRNALVGQCVFLGSTCVANKQPCTPSQGQGKAGNCCQNTGVSLECTPDVTGAYTCTEASLCVEHYQQCEREEITKCCDNEKYKCQWSDEKGMNLCLPKPATTPSTPSTPATPTTPPTPGAPSTPPTGPAVPYHTKPYGAACVKRHFSECMPPYVCLDSKVCG